MPTHFELLGLSIDEEEPSVIELAIKRQRDFMKGMRGGKFPELVDQILIQIQDAEITLLEPDSRRQYVREIKGGKGYRKSKRSGLSSGSRRGRTVGESSGITREFAGVMGVILAGFVIMAVVAFMLPWGNPPESGTEPVEAVSSPETPNSSDEPSAKAVVPAVNSIGMQFVPIPAGTFMMGYADYGPAQVTGPAHKVTLTQPFELGVYELTQEQYEKVMGTNPSIYKSPVNSMNVAMPLNPVNVVSWNDAVAFCQRLSEMPEEKATGHVYQLPTEAEWEYACRAGTTTKYSFGDSDSELGNYAWYYENSGDRSHAVGLKKPNPWGLYDMYGNVSEWCYDGYDGYESGSVTDPINQLRLRGEQVIRGGSWNRNSGYCSSAWRNKLTPDFRRLHLGFRVVRRSIK